MNEKPDGKMVAALLKFRRQGLRLRQTDVCWQLSCSLKFFQQLEKDATPAMFKLPQWCLILECDPEDVKRMATFPKKS